MDRPRLTVSPRLKALTSYDKFRAKTFRILVLESGYWLDSACARACEDMGWAVRRVPVTKEGHLPREAAGALFESLGTFKPDFILSINMGGMDVDGLFVGLFADLEIPFAVWFVDNPRTILMDRDFLATPYMAAFTWEREYEPYLRNLGYGIVGYLPLAVDHTLFHEPPGAEPDLRPAFVGSSMTEPAAREWAWLRGEPEIAEAVEGAFAQGKVTREGLGKGLGAVLDASVIEAMDEEGRHHAELYFFWEGTRRLRAAFAAALACEDVTFHGDAGWAASAVAAEGPVSYDGLPSFYRRCLVNLNSTSLQMASAANQRVFDCPACGGFLLTDGQADLYELFEVDREMAVYGSTEECIEKLRWFSGHPESRTELALRAHARVHGQHRYTHRMQTMVAIMKERFGGM